MSGLRPARSMSEAESTVMSTFPTFMSTATIVTVDASIPFCERNVELKLKALLMPENCCVTAHTSVISSDGRSFLSRSSAPMLLPLSPPVLSPPACRPRAANCM